MQGDEVEFFPEEKKVVGKRNVKIDYEDMQLTCDEITVFMQTKQAFAKGNVILDQGKMVITADEVEYDFDTRKGSIKNWSADSKKDKSIKPWYSKGSLAKGISKTKYEFINTYITSCNLPNPHYKIQAKKINVYLNDRVVAKKAVFKVGKIPVFYFPSYNYSLHTGRPQLSLIPGTNKDWGTYVLSAWTYYLNEKLKGRILLDYRSKLGFGEGIESDYKTGKFGGGKFTGYYTYEDDKDKLSSSSTKERFRIKIRHRWDITDKTYFTGECNKWSDDTFLKHYFESEFEQERRPETQFSLTHNDSQYSGNLLLNKRINHFFTNTEYLPQVKFHLKKQSLFNLPIYYGSELSAANLTRKNANSNIDNDAVRVNVFNEIWTQYKLFGISFTPRFGNQETYYSKNVFGDENRLRNAFNTGIEAKTKFFKTFNWSTDKWGLDINRLRHIVTPSIRYDYRHSPTISANNLAQFDDMDSLTRDNKVTLYLENKLQTKKNVDNGMITTELLRLIMQCNYEFKLEDGSRFTNVNADIELNPYSWMILESDVNFNTKTDHFDTYNLDFYVRKNDDFKTGIGYRYHRKENSELTGEIKKRITDKWKVRIYESFEFKTGSFYEQEYSIIRDLHCWEFVMNCNIKDSETFWFSLRLKDFPELPFKLKTGYNTPKGK